MRRTPTLGKRPVDRDPAEESEPRPSPRKSTPLGLRSSSRRAASLSAGSGPAYSVELGEGSKIRARDPVERVGPVPPYVTPEMRSDFGFDSDQERQDQRNEDMERATPKDIERAWRKWTQGKRTTRERGEGIWQGVPRAEANKGRSTDSLSWRAESGPRKIKLPTKEPSKFSVEPALTGAAGIRRFVKTFMLQARGKKVGEFLVDPPRVLDEEEWEELSWSPMDFLLGEFNRLAVRFADHIEDATSPAECLRILMALAPAENNPALLQTVEQEMRENTLAANNWDIDSLRTNLTGLNIRMKKGGGRELSDTAYRLMFANNIGVQSLTVALLSMNSVDKMVDLVKLCQANGQVPRKGSGAAGAMDSTLGVFMVGGAQPGPSSGGRSTGSATSGSSTDTSVSSTSSGGGRQKHTGHCDKCGTTHIKGEYHCPYECSHCHKSGHSKADCGARKKATQFKKYQKRVTRQLKDVLYADYQKEQEQQESLSTSFRRMGVQRPSHAYDRERQLQVLVNQGFFDQPVNGRAERQQRSAIRRERDRRGSFGDDGPDSQPGLPVALDRHGNSGNLGVYMAKFPTNGEHFWDFHRGQ